MDKALGMVDYAALAQRPMHETAASSSASG